MNKYTFNRENWTGEQATIEVRADGSFEFQGDLVELVARPNSTEVLAMFDVFCAGQKVASVSKFADCKYWTACSPFSVDLTRTDKVRQVAVAKLLSNI